MDIPHPTNFSIRFLFTLTPPYTHDKITFVLPPSSSGPGRSPLKAKTRVRFPLGAQALTFERFLCGDRFTLTGMISNLSVPYQPPHTIEVHEAKRRSIPAGGTIKTITELVEVILTSHTIEVLSFVQNIFCVFFIKSPSINMKT